MVVPPGSAMRMDRRYITLADDWGKARSASNGRLPIPCRLVRTGAAPSAMVTLPSPPRMLSRQVLTIMSRHPMKTNKIIGNTGHLWFQGRHFADAGAESKGNSTEYALQYGMSAFGDGTLKSQLRCRIAEREGQRGCLDQAGNHEIGAELSTGDLTLSAITFKKKATPNKGAGKVEQSGQEVDLSFKASDSLTVLSITRPRWTKARTRMTATNGPASVRIHLCPGPVVVRVLQDLRL